MHIHVQINKCSAYPDSVTQHSTNELIGCVWKRLKCVLVCLQQHGWETQM